MSKHIHAELMLDYAKDWAETNTPWERWEFFIDHSLGWVTIEDHPYWETNVKYRRKPKPYEPTLLDQALELEIEALRLKIRYYVDSPTNSQQYCYELQVLETRRTTAMIEHLKQQGKL